MKKYRIYGAIITICCVAVAALVSFQNCEGGFSKATLAEEAAPNAQGSPTPIPSSPTPTPTPATPTPTPVTPTPTPSTQIPQITRTDFLTGLDSPWDMAFVSDGTMFFTEKCRGLSVRLTSGTVRRLFGASGNAVVASDFFCDTQSGMNGVALDPNFATNRTLFVYMSSSLSNPKTNRVVRLVVDAAYSTVSQRTDIVTDIPFKNNGNAWGDPGVHSGGRIRFGPDGFLYITTGDNHNGIIPQNPTLMGGKVLRVDRNGAAAAGNNPPAGFNPRVYTYGHRNVQGISFHPSTGRAYISEHGPHHTDEVTPLVAGGNGGWDPVPAPGVTCQDNYCGYISNRPDGVLTAMTDLEKFPNAMRPIWTNNGQSEGMGPCEFIKGSQWKAWDGRLAVGMMGGTRIEILELNSSGGLVGTTLANLPARRMRSIVLAPDGNIYVAIDEGAIWKVVP